MTLSLEFDGAAGTVTGSRFLLQDDSTQVLIDCGLFQGLKELRLRNWAPPSFNPKDIDAVVLTHAHLDHSGYLPRLVGLGYRGPIYCTPATADVTRIVLLDAAKIQEEDAEYANRRHYSRHHPALPLFDRDDAEQAIRLFEPVKRNQLVTLGNRLAVRFHRAGHILGASFVVIQANLPGGRMHRLAFSGDLGRPNAPLHPDPEPLPPCDTLVIESTYGHRTHDSRPLTVQLANAIRSTLQHGGIVLIPAFAVARAQLITWLLREAMDDGALPRVPLHIDSPMATDVTDVYGKYLGTGELDSDTAARGARALFPKDVQLHRSVEQSKALNTLRGPRIIIAASGMLTGGRVLHHLERLAPDPGNLLLLAGYQAAGTRGRALLDGARELKMHGAVIPIRCRFAVVEGLSAHADAAELMAWASTPKLPKNVFLVHGEEEGLEGLARQMRAAHAAVHIPRMHQRFSLQESTNRWRETRSQAHQTNRPPA